MTEANASSPSAAKPVSKSPLDDVMIAMDVVDTLRHDRSLVDRELNDAARRQDLIDRLRGIYRAQGIEVSDRILEEGVRALEEDRFTYTPPSPEALTTRLARLYVSRWDWGKWVLGIAGGILVFYLGNYFAYERPRQLAQYAEEQQLARLPDRIRSLSASIKSEAADPLIGTQAEATAQTGANAAKTGDLSAARAAETELKDTLFSLRSVYDVRIVNRQGEVSGLWRIPDQNPDTYNFYLVVEAIGRDGRVLAQTITNEETGRKEVVKTWAQRVDRQVLERVKADKDDDGIIQNNIVGRKVRGRLTPDWSISVQGGAITRW